MQTTEGLLDHTSLGGTIRRRRLAKERLVNAGTVIGLDEQLLQAPYRCTYVTSSFVHLFFFDKTQVWALFFISGRSVWVQSVVGCFGSDRRFGSFGMGRPIWVVRFRVKSVLGCFGLGRSVWAVRV